MKFILGLVYQKYFDEGLSTSFLSQKTAVSLFFAN
jgi:hypothetical protein